VAFLCLCLVSSLQAWSTKAGKSAQVVTTLFKVIAIFVIFIAGIVWLCLGRIASSFSFEGSTHQPTGYALALFSALWAYDGFDQVNYVARETKAGHLPVMINSSLALIIVLFLLTNIAYFIVLPFDVVRIQA
jgi:amino acid transporter